MSRRSSTGSERAPRPPGARVLHLDCFSGIAGNMCLAALLGMLNSCAAGVSVVNIDNGFGAGYMACSILRSAAAAR